MDCDNNGGRERHEWLHALRERGSFLQRQCTKPYLRMAKFFECYPAENFWFTSVSFVACFCFGHIQKHLAARAGNSEKFGSEKLHNARYYWPNKASFSARHNPTENLSVLHRLALSSRILYERELVSLAFSLLTSFLNLWNKKLHNQQYKQKIISQCQ